MFVQYEIFISKNWLKSQSMCLKSLGGGECTPIEELFPSLPHILNYMLTLELLLDLT